MPKNAAVLKVIYFMFLECEGGKTDGGSKLEGGGGVLKMSMETRKKS
jgi:hypothetical protein